VPVQGCTLPLPYSTATPLLPLWAVRPVQSLSACTRVHFTFTLQYSYTCTPPTGRTACTEPQCLYKGALYLYFTVQLYLYSPYGPYGLYRASVPVQGCTLPLLYSTAIPLLPLRAVRPVQSLSACTRVHFNLTLHQVTCRCHAADVHKFHYHTKSINVFFDANYPNQKKNLEIGQNFFTPSVK